MYGLKTAGARGRRAAPWLAGIMLLAPSAPTWAAPAPQSPGQLSAPAYPPAFRVRRHGDDFHYVDARGMTLYALNQRVAFSRSGGQDPYCVGPCARVWTEVSAPADAKPVGDWSVVTGARGPQWAYRKNPVFTYAADRAPGQIKGDGYEDLWSLIAFVPPPPSLTAPPGVAPLYANGRYVLADSERHALFVAAGKTGCGPGCEDWTPLLAGLSARDLGDWRVDRDGVRARWTWRGKLVFVSPSDKPAAVPNGGQVLSP